MRPQDIRHRARLDGARSYFYRSLSFWGRAGSPRRFEVAKARTRQLNRRARAGQGIILSQRVSGRHQSLRPLCLTLPIQTEDRKLFLAIFHRRL